MPPRSSSAALFTPLLTSLILSLICYPAMNAFFSGTVPADYSPLMRSALLSSVVLVAATCLLQLILSAAQKTSTVSPHIGAAAAAGSQPTAVGQPAAAAAQPAPAVAAAGAVAKLSRRLLLSPRHALSVANAFCCGSATLLLVFSVCFLQSTTLSGQLDPSTTLQRSGGKYASSQLADWTHAVAGSSGGWMKSQQQQKVMIPVQPVVAPFMGSIHGGMVMAYLLLMFLLSIYVSFMATPELASSYLFMEPRFLVICSGFLGFGTGQAVADTFATCSDPSGSIVGFVCFVLIACFFDLPLLLVLGGNSSIQGYAKGIGLEAMAIVPLFFFLSGSVPPALQAASGILVAAATLSNAVDVVFRQWNPASSWGEDDNGDEMVVPLAVASGTTKGDVSSSMWQIPVQQQQQSQAGDALLYPLQPSVMMRKRI